MHDRVEVLARKVRGRLLRRGVRAQVPLALWVIRREGMVIRRVQQLDAADGGIDSRSKVGSVRGAQFEEENREGAPG